MVYLVRLVLVLMALVIYLVL